MKKMEIRERIREDLKIGSRLERGYIAEFNRLYKGSARAIDDFHVRYNDDGTGVIFVLTINGKQIELEGNLADWRKC